MKLDKRKTRQRTEDDIYGKIIEALTEPMSCKQISTKINHLNGSVINMMHILYDAGFVIRDKPDRIWLYSRLVDKVTTEEVYIKRNGGMAHREEKKPTILGARVIDFNKKELSDKIALTCQQTRKERKQGKNYVTGSTLSWI